MMNEMIRWNSVEAMFVYCMVAITGQTDDCLFLKERTSHGYPYRVMVEGWTDRRTTLWCYNYYWSPLVLRASTRTMKRSGNDVSRKQQCVQRAVTAVANPPH